MKEDRRQKAENRNQETKTGNTENTFDPKIIAFLCNWCSYAGADKAGSAQAPCPPNVSVLRVMCSGRVDPQFVLKAFEQGADGVLILACHPGDCHYKEGNIRSAQRHGLLVGMLSQFGIEGARCRFDYVSAGEGERFIQVTTEMTDHIRSLGPLRIAPVLATTPGQADCGMK